MNCGKIIQIKIYIEILPKKKSEKIVLLKIKLNVVYVILELFLQNQLFFFFYLFYYFFIICNMYILH